MRAHDEQQRIDLERRCRELAEVLSPKVPAGVGFMLWIMNHGNAGSLAYVASVEREGAIKTCLQWLERQRSIDGQRCPCGWPLPAEAFVSYEHDASKAPPAAVAMSIVCPICDVTHNVSVGVSATA
jgi:hypothetical protein